MLILILVLRHIYANYSEHIRLRVSFGKWNIEKMYNESIGSVDKLLRFSSGWLEQNKVEFGPNTDDWF